jgi:hypothetical protein
VTDLPTCEYKDPETKGVCGRQVKMPPMHDDATFGRYLCSDHIKQVNQDRDEVRAQAAALGWNVADGPEGLMLSRPDAPVGVGWDPLAGHPVHEVIDYIASYVGPGERVRFRDTVYPNVPDARSRSEIRAGDRFEVERDGRWVPAEAVPPPIPMSADPDAAARLWGYRVLGP